jgi:hypothetical protein
MRAAQLLEREAELGDGAGLEVLHEHVGLREQGGEHRLVLAAREVEGERLLAAVEPDEIRALASRQFVVAAGEIALRPLDLDHARAGIREAAAAHRRRHRLLQRHDQEA